MVLPTASLLKSAEAQATEAPVAPSTQPKKMKVKVSSKADLDVSMLNINSNIGIWENHGDSTCKQDVSWRNKFVGEPFYLYQGLNP